MRYGIGTGVVSERVKEREKDLLVDHVCSETVRACVCVSGAQCFVFISFFLLLFLFYFALQRKLSLVSHEIYTLCC